MVDGQLLGGEYRPAVDAAVAVPLEHRLAPHMTGPLNLDPRRLALGAAKRIFFDNDQPVRGDATDAPPRLTPRALENIPIMSRSRERILANLDEMYREAFERAKGTEDSAQMASLDFAYRREQLYFEILLDVRDAVERR
ncbi:MAG: hypothetical protein NVS1B4_24400 [Gemmatimonadaceae bacterium]